MIPVVIIQSTYRSYKIRKKISFFAKLPNDLWKKILYHIRESFLLEKFHYKPLRTIIDKYIPILYTTYHDISHLYKLSVKYYIILTKSMKDMLFRYGIFIKFKHKILNNHLEQFLILHSI